MTHDPLCWCASQHPEQKPGLLCPRQNECRCECIIIAEVRADEKAKWVIRPQCDLSPNGRHGDFRFGPAKDLCGYCSEDVSYLFEMGQ